LELLGERDENQIKPQVRKPIAGPTSEPRNSYTRYMSAIHLAAVFSTL
jgi:hypothetical protein